MKKFLFILTVILMSLSIYACNFNNKKQEVQEVIELINDLPEVITLDDEDAINNCFNKYNSLNTSKQELVTNYNVLISKQQELDKLKEDILHQNNANIVIEMINALPEVITLDDEESINNCFNKYNLLNSLEKELVTNYNVLTSKQQELDKLKEDILHQNNANIVIEMINALPEVITLDDEESINNCFNKYNLLSSLEKELVTNYNVLISKQQELDKLKEDILHQNNANIVIEMINALPEVITYLDEDAINNVFEKYDSLLPIEQSLVTNYDVLLEKKEALDKAKEELHYVNIIYPMINNIDKLPNVDEVKLSDEEEVLLLYYTYLELSKEDQALITNRDKLLELVEIVEMFYKVEYVISLIDNLPSLNDITLVNQESIDVVANAYNELTPYLKTLVSNIDLLNQIKEKITELEYIESLKKKAMVVIELINNLPNVITINDKEAIDNCFNAYNNLTAEEQQYVTNYDELTLKYEKLSEIIANTSYDVKLILDGGYLEGMKEIVKNEEVCEFVINNYSCNIWSVYSTSIFIYKTSLMNSGDQFTSFIKVGFSYNASAGTGEVNQIVPAGTALSAELKTNDYYILVHPNYDEGYSKVSMLEIGTKLNINKQLPDSSTDTLNCNINAYNEGSDVEYMITLKGINTLPIPQKVGYKFIGWYKESSFLNVITEVKENTTVYAKWMQDKGEITTESILNCVSDVVTSNTTDELMLENEDAYFTWSSSNNKLYNINNGFGTVSKMYQTHKKQTVKVSVEIKYKTGGSRTLSKDIIVNPVLFNDFSSTPIATYFYTGAISAYQKYNERYKTNQTLFSDTTKETLDIVYYAFIVPESDGSVSFQNASYLDEVKELKNHDVRILGCVNGVGTATATAFKTITADATLRKTFINNLMNLVEQYNLDGLDLDWEAVSSSLTPIASQYNLLCEELRAEMTRRQDEGGSAYLLTMAVPASSYGTSTDRFDFKTLNKYVDYINIMSYDLNDSSKTTHLSPLYSSSKDNGYGFGAVYGVNRISSLGFDKNKLIIGCAGYGKAYSVSGGSGTYPALGISGTLTKISGYDGSFSSGTVYGSVIDQLIKSGRYQEYTEVSSSGKVVGSYLYSATDRIFVTYDSKIAVMAKYEYAKANGIGMMCWAYTEDTSDTVINAIYEAKNK